ncbi:unnamed protein product [Cylicocyclus nassatus]|uniref:Apple domain-containing protein n=1 Tax=Cylicocyclus nassatus TaxID=53992 RepID=A0AA36HH82_CYLNA|nr:unnamed protein product [Cylicocyclus nassatus]
MTAYCCTIILLNLAYISAFQDHTGCFASHKNVRVTCVKPAENRTLSSVNECEEFCLTLPKVCRTAQFDAGGKTCEIFSSPPLIGLAPIQSGRRHYRDVQSHYTIEKCAPALQPSVGSIYLIPKEECFGKSEKPNDSNSPVIGNVIPSEEKSFGGEFGLQLKPPRNPLSAIPVEILPIVPDCPIGEKARVQVIDGVEVVSSASVTFTTNTPETCVHACMTSSYPDATRLPLLCRSAQYDRQSSKCFLYPDAVNPNGYLEYKPNVDVLYTEKICISDLLLPISCDEIFRRIPQHILFGHASEIVTATSEEECIRECIQAKVKRNIECHSLLHYADVPISNCILNVQTRLTRPEYFVPELDDKVDYVQLPECAKKTGQGHASAVNGRSRSMIVDNKGIEKKSWGLPHGVGSVESEWSEWTNCDQKTSVRRRERLCSDCLEKVQTQPCFSNEGFENAINTFIEEQNDTPDTTQTMEVNGESPKANVIPFPLSTVLSENNATTELEFFGPPFDNRSPTAWKSAFRRF